MKNEIDLAKEALAKVREENKEREAAAASEVTAAVSRTFTHKAKVKVKDHINGKNGKTVVGGKYEVDFVKDTNVFCLGKGQKVKVFTYDQLELI